ncbi:MAG: preprotein translocase subunit SecY [Deltaproteobacteria bacterium]|jgi:preprotein translocase subunit SecY|nr:preprotein translocase subunit SecY [Deltaproteobacteria bacterium]
MGGFENLGQAVELRKRLLYVLIILAIYRVGVHIPTPGVNTEALAVFFARFQGTLLGLFDMFSGKALSQFSIFAMGIMPYISASIIIELLTVVWPHLARLKKEGGQDGRRKLTQYSRYLTVGLSLFQGFMLAVGLERMNVDEFTSVVITPGLNFRLMTTITLAAGTCFIMWLGEQITERGIGNGISLIIFAGIVDALPSAIIGVFRDISGGSQSILAMVLLTAAMIFIIAGVVFCERAQRRVQVQYAQKMVGRKMVEGRASHLPLKLNPAGVIPPIFASSLIMFPATLGQFMEHPFFKTMSDWLNESTILYNLIYVALIVFFCYFYTGVQFNPTDVAENMKKQGGFIPGIRPGQKTAEYIDRVLTRITLWGALYVSLICVLPSLVRGYFRVDFWFGGTALLIVVGVALDTIAQIQSYVYNQNYDGFLKKGLAGVGRIQPRRR